jgi:hypothetical protein
MFLRFLLKGHGLKDIFFIDVVIFYNRHVIFVYLSSPGDIMADEVLCE